MPEIKKRAREIEVEQKKPGFWENNKKAAEMSQELADLKVESEWFIKREEECELLRSEIEDGPSWARGDEKWEEKNKSWRQDITENLQVLEKKIFKKEKELSFSGPHDKAGAIITIQAGLGGTDAMDWAQMLERMYLRLAENKGWRAIVLERSLAEEAGIKHSTIELVGKFAYGVLKNEHGVHRLVRQSPFNSDNLRQTSFARIEVLPKLDAKEAPEIDPEDLKIDTYRAGGAGGQHVNKTSSAVRITHLPTGVVVQCQNQRSQAQNKAYAMSVLQSKLQVLIEEKHAHAVKELKGEYKEAAWGNQIRSYVLHPYKMIKDHRTGIEETNVQKVLDGDLGSFIPEI